jgi:NAD(P)-dependent dehydrogenase (short-subunit alcohol dehydrogenase family)
MILFGRELVRRRLAPSNRILVTSVHPGTVDTDIQEGPAQSYGLPGKLLDQFMRLIGKSAPEGAEASLWAATCADINASNVSEYQVRILLLMAMLYNAR